MSKPPAPEPLLSPNEIGAALEVTGASVRRWVRDGLLKPTEVSPSGYYRFRLSDVQKQREAMREIRLPARRYVVDQDGNRHLVREEDAA